MIGILIVAAAAAVLALVGFYYALAAVVGRGAGASAASGSSSHTHNTTHAGGPEDQRGAACPAPLFFKPKIGYLWRMAGRCATEISVAHGGRCATKIFLWRMVGVRHRKII